MGQTVVKYDKYCRGSKDYFSLAREIITSEQSAQTQSEQQPQEVKFTSLSNRMQEMVKEEAKDFMVTTFSLEAPDARSVYVTGSFNDWSLDESCRMRLENEGRWIVSVPLRQGTHKYQFIVDGRWREDPANPRQERNSFGDINSLIEVKMNGHT